MIKANIPAPGKTGVAFFSLDGTVIATAFGTAFHGRSFAEGKPPYRVEVMDTLKISRVAFFVDEVVVE